jgi:hypothetical protein
MMFRNQRTSETESRTREKSSHCQLYESIPNQRRSSKWRIRKRTSALNPEASPRCIHPVNECIRIQEPLPSFIGVVFHEVIMR